MNWLSRIQNWFLGNQLVFEHLVVRITVMLIRDHKHINVVYKHLEDFENGK